MPTGAPPLNFNQTAPGWNTGPSMADTGRYNAMGSRPMPGPGFWSGVGNTASNVGGSILNLLGRGIGVLAGGIGGNNGITPSAGGWAIDKNGNLVNTSSTSTSSPNQARTGPSPISHTTSVPGLASLFMGDIAKRNLL